jgi:hypothetical protein
VVPKVVSILFGFFEFICLGAAAFAAVLYSQAAPRKESKGCVVGATDSGNFCSQIVETNPS